MTEQEWLATPHIVDVVNSVEVRTERRIRLFAVACLRRVESFLTDERLSAAIPALEQRAEGNCSIERLEELHRQSQEAVEEMGDPPRGMDGLNGFMYADYWKWCAGWAVIGATTP